MADQITKIIVRRGTDAERRTANGTGVSFNVAEPAYCIDTQRLFIGNGSPGGVPAGIRNLGVVNNLFANQVNGYSFDANYLFSTSGIEVGDIIYDKTTRNIYSLSGRSSFPPLTSDFVKYDTLTLINDSQFFYDNSLKINLKDLGVTVTKVSPNVFDGTTITKQGALFPAGLQTGSSSTGVNRTHFQFFPSNSLLLNSSTLSDIPNYVAIGPNQFVGRINGSSLSGVDVISLLANGISAINGLIGYVDPNNQFTLTLDPDAFGFDFSNTFVKNNLVARQTFTAQGAASCDNGLTVRAGLDSFQKGTFRQDLEVFGSIVCRNDITAFFSSDEKLKKNIKILNNSLDKIKQIDGVEFDWNENTEHSGHDLGVIAQQVEKVFPDIVATRDNGYKAVRYEKLIPVLIEAIKELARKVEVLELR